MKYEIFRTRQFKKDYKKLSDDNRKLIIEDNIRIFKDEKEANKCKQEYDGSHDLASWYAHLVEFNGIYYCLIVCWRLTDIWGS